MGAELPRYVHTWCISDESRYMHSTPFLFSEPTENDAAQGLSNVYKVVKCVEQLPKDVCIGTVVLDNALASVCFFYV